MQFTDETLIDETRAGSHVAFEQLMKRYERLVFRVAYSWARQSESAFDISQNVFLKAYCRLDGYRGTGSFKGWLLRITNNESSNWLRQNRRHSDHEELTPANAPMCQPAQETTLLGQENQQLLLDQLADLNPRQRQAVSLRYFEGLPIREIAGALDCSEGVVKSILFRSIKKLRDRLTLRRSEP